MILFLVAWLIVGHPVRVCFTWGTETRVYTRRRKLSARATPRNSLVSPLVAGWPRSIRMSIRITTTERARNNFCSWDWSHWMDRRSFQLAVLHIRAAVPPFQSSLLQEKTASFPLFYRPAVISIDRTFRFKEFSSNCSSTQETHVC